MHGLNGAAFMPRTGIRQPENRKSAIVGRFSGCLQGCVGVADVVFLPRIIFPKFTACKPK